MNRLGALADGRDGHLQRLRTSEGATLLTRLARSECLLALARLSQQRIDLLSYAGAAVGELAQCVPLQACRIRLHVPGLPAMEAGWGDLGLLAGAEAHLLHTADEPVGALEVLAELPELLPDDFVDEAVGQLSDSLGALIEAERLRRRAALSQALQLAQALSDGTTAELLGDLVSAVASLPGALGARLVLQEDDAAPVVVEAGGAPDEPPGPARPATLDVRWSRSARDADRAAGEQVQAAIEAALARAEERRRLRDEAETDALTGLGNRRRMRRVLAAELAEVTRQGGVLGLLYLDLDHFKAVNDSLGHEAGDVVLARFARLLAEAVRGGDTVCRPGGEEFVVVCPGLGAAAGQALARRILAATPAACAEVLPPGWHQTTSCGLAVAPADGTDPDALLRAADEALYSAKRAGRHTVATPAGPSGADLDGRGAR